ncbi:alpha/beta hydrolase [Desertimonas flava]|uniref:alpha/beta hydrolase n=1 Tax=Desertimonas flava TaxID=2064846 RepID=UPI000E34FD21|nr:alpha/beta hydrolase [Desertimonas flava]
MSARAELEAALAPLMEGVVEGEPTLATQREGQDRFGDLIPLPDGARVRDDTLGGVPVRYIEFDGTAQGPVLFYLHGGGYTIGSLRSHQGFVGTFAGLAGGWSVQVDYRLGPEHPHPAAVDDAVAAYLALVESGVDPGRIVVSGDSAGGGLSLALLVALRDGGHPQPAGATLMSPWTDLSFTGESMTTNKAVDTMVMIEFISVMANDYMADGDPTNPLISPVYADLTGLAPLQLHVGGDEILLDDSQRIADHAAAVGVPCDLHVWPEMLHIFPYFAPLLPQGHVSWQALGMMVDFVKEHAA